MVTPPLFFGSHYHDRLCASIARAAVALAVRDRVENDDTAARVLVDRSQGASLPGAPIIAQWPRRTQWPSVSSDSGRSPTGGAPGMRFGAERWPFLRRRGGGSAAAGRAGGITSSLGRSRPAVL